MSYMMLDNTYLVSKRDTKHLLYWMIHTSNGILQSSASSHGEGTPKKMNTTGQVSRSGLMHVLLPR